MFACGPELSSVVQAILTVLGIGIVVFSLTAVMAFFAVIMKGMNRPYPLRQRNHRAVPFALD